MCVQISRVSDEQDAPIRIVLPFKDQKSTNAVRNQLSDLSRKINAVVQPVYVSKKIKRHFKPKEHKPPIVNQQNVVYYYKCGLCDTDYVGFTSRHLHQRVEEHKRSTIGYHVKDEHGGDPDSIGNNFEILKKCQSKLDCLIFEMLFIRKLKPKLNKQIDSICAIYLAFLYYSCRNFFFSVFILFLCKYFRVLVSILLAFL